LQGKLCPRIWYRHTRGPYIINHAIESIKGQGIPPSKVVEELDRTHLDHIGS
jgi:hypothetical protein